MKKNILKSFNESIQNLHRRNQLEWILLHADGDYEVRSPDTVYIHRFEVFDSEEQALSYLNHNIAPVDRRNWRLYQEVSIERSQFPRPNMEEIGKSRR